MQLTAPACGSRSADGRPAEVAGQLELRHSSPSDVYTPPWSRPTCRRAKPWPPSRRPSAGMSSRICGKHRPRRRSVNWARSCTSVTVPAVTGSTARAMAPARRQSSSRTTVQGMAGMEDMPGMDKAPGRLHRPDRPGRRLRLTLLRQTRARRHGHLHAVLGDDLH